MTIANYLSKRLRSVTAARNRWRDELASAEIALASKNAEIERLKAHVAMLEEQREVLIEFSRRLAGQDWRGNRPSYIDEARNVVEKVYEIAQAAVPK